MQYTALRRDEGSKIKNIQKVKNFCYALFLKKKKTLNLNLAI